MEYQIQREGDVAVLELHGVLDVASAPTFQTALQSILDEGGNRVAVDMADVSFMDSSGLGVLIAAYRRLSGGGGQIALVNVVPAVHKVLQLTRTDQLFSLHDTLPTAITALQ